VAPTVLFIYNDPIAPQALLGDAFADKGFDIDTFNVVPVDRTDDPVLDVAFPDPLRYDVIVPLGSRWSVHDTALRETWVGTEMAMVRTAVDAGVGVLGVCFGGQLVAAALGGSVNRSPAPELGWYEITSTAPDLIGPGPWFEWHSDRWSTPAGGTELARTADATQAFTLGTALALQFHPEVDTPLVRAWLDGDSDGDVPRLGVDRAALERRTIAEAAAAPRRLAELVTAFVDRVARPVRQSS